MSNDEPQDRKSHREWGLAGLGVGGRFTIEVDEPIDGVGPSNVQISGPRWMVAVAISGREEIRSLFAFAKGCVGTMKSAEHRFGATSTGAVYLTKDGESPVRFFLYLVANEGEMKTWITIQDDETAEFVGALEDVCRDLFDDENPSAPKTVRG